MSIREERAAKNEATAREINEQIQDAFDDSPPSWLVVVCECAYPGCEEVVRLTREQYERIRSHPRAFAVVPSHVILEVEQVVAEAEEFVVVVKREGIGAERPPEAVA